MLHLRKVGIVLTGAALLGITAVNPAAAQQTLYAIANGGTSLIRFQSNNPGGATLVGNFGGASSFLDGMAFRPSTGQLYGYLSSANAYYTVNLNNAQLTKVSATPAGASTNTFDLGMSFNPTVDLARVVTDSTQNVVFNPTTGTATAATNLAYAATDKNAGIVPLVIANAYSNNIARAFSTTQQYGIDYGTDSLVTIANNAGTLTTVGSLGVDTDIYSGLSIFTTLTGVNTAYAILGAPGSNNTSLYNINLTTGSASAIGAFSFGQVYGLAAVPTAVPEPGAVAMLIGSGMSGFVFLRRRRR
jgi:hypothetical protein